MGEGPGVRVPEGRKGWQKKMGPRPSASRRVVTRALSPFPWSGEPKIFVFACRFASDIYNVREPSPRLFVEPVGFLADNNPRQKYGIEKRDGFWHVLFLTGGRVRVLSPCRAHRPHPISLAAKSAEYPKV